MSAFVRTLAVLVSAATLWGCTTTTDPAGQDDAAAATATTGTQDSQVGGGVEVAPVAQGTGFSGDPLNDPDSLLSKRVVYFDFDKADISPEARRIIEAHAQYLSQNPHVRITLEGHCDERGTREYNLGLGERRSKAVQQVMMLMGVSANQLELVSYGEERPVAMGHDDDSWALNRRTELVYR